MLYPLLEQYDIDCKRAIAYGFSRTGAGFELKKELPDAGLYAVFVMAGKHFEVNVFDAYTDEEYLPFNVADNITGFVSGIREQVETLVQEIKEKCLFKANMKLRRIALADLEQSQRHLGRIRRSFLHLKQHE